MIFAWLRPGLTIALLVMVAGCGRGNAPAGEAPSTPTFGDPTVPAQRPRPISGLTWPRTNRLRLKPTVRPLPKTRFPSLRLIRPSQRSSPPPMPMPRLIAIATQGRFPE
ncbi:MAG: hypothetical protein HC812_16670 [Leptolyngbya sp. RL_3_1]|nr:hypothetical protein [Leptolyngbya sp. RL_3_1]